MRDLQQYIACRLLFKFATSHLANSWYVDTLFYCIIGQNTFIVYRFSTNNSAFESFIFKITKGPGWRERDGERERETWRGREGVCWLAAGRWLPYSPLSTSPSQWLPPLPLHLPPPLYLSLSTLPLSSSPAPPPSTPTIAPHGPCGPRPNSPPVQAPAPPCGQTLGSGLDKYGRADMGEGAPGASK